MKNIFQRCIPRKHLTKHRKRTYLFCQNIGVLRAKIKNENLTQDSKTSYLEIW
ncbi:hypothetical protein CP8484711_1350 [Chlamydia psittaci 84-8471/1]|nr:hypothetical protein CP8484711_1350 [Chlamydia psittaci 84-8471/1]